MQIKMSKVFGPIGSCIYCGSTENLEKEHVIPRGLGGEHILLKASCENCRRITTRFERHVLRELLLVARTTLNLPTYHKKRRPKSFTFTVVKNNKKKRINIPADECPTIITMPYYKRPRYISQYPYKKGIIMTGISGIVTTERLQRLKEKYDFDTFATTLTYTIGFAHLLAKMAYGMAVAQYGLKNISETHVLPAILGEKDDIGYWVGCTDDSMPPKILPKENLLYKLDLGRKSIGNREEVIAIIRLFLRFPTPEYSVYVGCLR